MLVAFALGALLLFGLICMVADAVFDLEMVEETEERGVNQHKVPDIEIF